MPVQRRAFGSATENCHRAETPLPIRWAFGPIWTTLYLLMGVALYRVRRDGRGASGALAVGLFCLQLGLNVL